MPRHTRGKARKTPIVPPNRQGAALAMPSSGELRRSEGAGFRNGWSVYSEYRIETREGQRILVAVGRIERFYAPAIEDALVKSFRLVRDEKSLLEFAHRYGQLGHWAVVEPEKRLGGDPVAWVLAHAAQVRAVYNLLDIIRDARNGKWEPSQLRKPVGQAAGMAGVHLPGERRTGRERRFFDTVHWPENPIRTAYEVVASLINPQIRGIYYELASDEEIPGLFLHFRALVEMLYWHLAQELKGEWRRCKRPDCPVWFPVDKLRRGPKRKYCRMRCKETDKKRRKRASEKEIKGVKRRPAQG